MSTLEDHIREKYQLADILSDHDDININAARKFLQDFYDVEEEDLVELDLVAVKKAVNITLAISKKLSIGFLNLKNLLQGNLHRVSETNATVDRVINALQQSVDKIPDVVGTLDQQD